MAADPTYPAKLVQRRQDGSLDVPTGAVLNIEAGGQLQVGGVDVTSSVSGSAVAGVAAGYKIARGQTTTASASDTVATGLTTVVSVVANLEDAPVATCDRGTASLGNQSGAPVAGSILVQTWMPTSAGSTIPIAATTFGKKVNWIAVGV